MPNTEKETLASSKSVIEELAKVEAEAASKLIKTIHEAMIATYKKQLEALGTSETEQEKALAELRKKLLAKDSDEQQKALRIASKNKKKTYQEMNLYERRLTKEAEKAKLESQKKLFTEQKKLEKKIKSLESDNSDEAIQKLQEAKSELDKINKELAGVSLEAVDKDLYEINAQLEGLNRVPLTFAEKAQYYADQLEEAGKQREEAEKELLDIQTKSLTEMDEETRKQEEKAAKKKLKAAEKREKKLSVQQEIAAKNAEEMAKQMEKNATALAELTSSDYWKDQGKQAAANAVNNAVDFIDDLTKAIDTSINDIYEGTGKFQARLVGSEVDYLDMMKDVSKQIGLSSYINQKDMVNSIQELVGSGVSYNVELRAYLATVSENIASTFDAFDARLLQLIRLQQKDSTTARLGMEASLNEFYNKMFSDTSYLGGEGGGVYDTISNTITNTSALLNHDIALEFEYVVQKWLGALYSVGASEDFITKVATGINMLGTGDVEGLNSNEQLQNLMAMSAVRSGESYADLLINGLDASKTNKLLGGMLEYLEEIRNNTTGNRVTQTAYADVFGLSASDLRAVYNLASSADTMNTLYNTTLNYKQAVAETNQELKEIKNRVHLSEALSTLIENATTSASLKIGSNTFTYGTWQILNIIEGLTGGIAIPGISIMGNMVDLHATVTGLAKAGIAGISLMDSLISSLANLGSGGLPALDKWGGQDTVTRGTEFTLNYPGVQSGLTKSQTATTMNSDSTTYVDNSLSEAAEDAESTGEITNKSVEEDTVTGKETRGFYEENLKYLEQIASMLGNINSKPLPVDLQTISTNSQKTLELAVYNGFNGDNISHLGADSNIAILMQKLEETLPDILKSNLVNGVEYQVEVSNLDMLSFAAP